MEMQHLIKKNKINYYVDPVDPYLVYALDVVKYQVSQTYTINPSSIAWSIAQIYGFPLHI